MPKVKIDKRQIVHTTSLFSVDSDFEDERFMRVRIAALHSGLNKNNSDISKDAIVKAQDSFANIPILAYVVKTKDAKGNVVMDYAGHEMHIEQDAYDPESQRMIYDEQVVGVVPESNNFELIYNEETEKWYAWVDALVYRDYGNYCADILEAKGGQTDVSSELWCDSIKYDGKSKTMKIDTFTMTGITMLGEGVEPAMESAHAEMFSLDKDTRNDQMMLIMQELKESLDNYIAANEQHYNLGKEENQKAMTDLEFKELLAKFEKTEEDITFEWEGMSKEEFEAKMKELFDGEEGEEGGEEGQDNGEEGGEGGEPTDPAEPEEPTEPETPTNPETPEDPTPTPTDPVTPVVNDDEGDDNDSAEESNDDEPVINDDEQEKKPNFTKRTFELSFDDVYTALYELLYSAGIDAWISECYEDKFIYQTYPDRRYFSQTYVSENDQIGFSGDAIEVFPMYVTAEEKSYIDVARANYADASAELAKFKSEPEKMEIFSSKEWELISETEEFATLMKQENHFDLSKEDITGKLNAMLLEFVKKGKKNEMFSAKETKPVARALFAFGGMAEVNDSNDFLDKLRDKVNKKES